MAVDWNADGMRMWREKAVQMQQNNFDSLGTPMWREFEPSQYCNLKRQIGFALFGAPDEVPRANLNEGTGYTHKKLKNINEIFYIIEKCIKKNPNPNNIQASFLYVCGKTSEASITVPVIRILQFDTDFEQNINVFIDSCGRVYKNWQDYLDNNKIPECVLCYPRNGVYSTLNGAVEVEFGMSPAGRIGAKCFQVIDTGGSVLNVGAVGALTAAAFMPVATPIVAGAVGLSVLTGVYSAGRNIQTLVDRDQHQQSIGLDSAETRNCWLGIAGSVVGIASACTIALAAKSVRANGKMSNAGEITIQSVAVSSLFLNSLALGNGVANIFIKVRNREEITALDVFQVTSTVLFFTHSVISTRQAMSLINSMGMDSSGGSSGGIKAWMDRIYEFVVRTKGCITVPGVDVGCSPRVLTSAEGKKLFLSVCSVVGRKLKEMAKSLLRDITSRTYNYLSEVGELLHQYWESWKKEIAEVIDIICRAFGVKHWSELLINGCRITEFGHIRAMASTLITERRSLVECGITAMPSNQRQANSENSAAVGTDDEPNSVVDGETPNYYDEISNIHEKFLDQQTCRNTEDFRKYVLFICKYVKGQLQKEMKIFEEKWGMVKHYNPDVNFEDFKKQCGISGNPHNHFLQKVFNEFKEEEKEAFNLLRLDYLRQNAGTSAQEEENAQGFLDVDGVRFYQLNSMSGLASNGMPSKQQYREMAAKFTGRRADTDSIYMSPCGDTSVITVNDAAEVIMVQCWEEDGEVSGIAAVLRTALE